MDLLYCCVWDTENDEEVRMKKFKTIVSVIMMLLCGFVGLWIDDAMGGVAGILIAGIACIIYTIDNQEK